MRTAARRALVLGVALVLTGCGGSAASPASAAGTGAPPGISASPSTALPGASPRPAWLVDLSNPALDPGVPYYFELPVPVTFSVPAGWGYVGSSQNASVIANAQQTAVFSWLVADNLYRDPCHWQKGVFDPPLGPSVDDLVKALEKLPDFQVTGPASVTLGGLAAQRLALVQTIRSPDCDGSQMKVWSWEPSGNGHDLYGGPITVWVLSVGATRLVMFSWTSSGLDAAATSDVMAIAESIRFK
jgi:hypothetical protein